MPPDVGVQLSSAHRVYLFGVDEDSKLVLTSSAAAERRKFGTLFEATYQYK
jgi:hypothetical protein